MNSFILHPEYLLLDPTAAYIQSAVAISDGRIAAIGNAAELQLRYPTFPVRRLDRCILMPGFVNAHQHGRGISQIQLGYRDDFLEPWIASRRARGVLDAYAIARLAALRMAANGVTTAIHANYAFGSGDYEAEVRGQIRAYREVGIRVAMCIGAMDQGMIAYPPHEACFCQGLSPSLRDWVCGSGKNAYAGDGVATIALMDRLLADFGSDPGVRLLYGPAGPQWVSDGLWRELAADALSKNLGIHFHGMESAAQQLATRELFPEGAYAHLESLGALSPRTTIAHAVRVNDADIEVIARTGATVVRNPACNLRVRSGIAPMAQFLAKGIKVAIGTDNISLRDDEDLLGELRLADLLARSPALDGLPAPSTAQLLEMITVNGAHAAGFGDETGTIVVGRSADLVAVSLDSTRHPYLDDDMPLMMAFLTKASGADVRMTIVAGRIVYADGEFPGLDIAEVEANAVATAIAARRARDPEAPARTALLMGALNKHYRDLASAASKGSA
ncbi:MAG TPA: amidohydrolase family protein [Bauldia sp.]|nr:amidohydrolase family protein [Bauldia sp.]